MPPQPGQSKADAVVIGAGIAGLMAAALLAERGYKVAVLERDIHPGGCAAHFQKDGYSFAVGATVAMGLEPGGLLRTMYKRFGLEPRYVAVSPAIRVHLPDRVAEVKTDHQAWFEELTRVFPGQQKAKLAFWQEVKTLARGMHYASKRFPVLPFRTVQDVFDTAKAAHPSLLPLLFKLRQTTTNRLDHFGIDDPSHKAFIDGQLLDAMQTTSDTCVASNAAYALDIYRYGCQYKIGGLASIAEDLVTYLEQKGSRVYYGTRAKAIHSHDGCITGISTNQGDIKTSVVISAIPLENTVSLLASHVSTLQARSKQQAEMWGAFTLYLGIDERCLPVDSHVYEQITDLDLHETGNILISISPAWDRSRSPEGKRAITVSTHVKAKPWIKVAQDKEAYAQAKQQMEEALLKQVERVIPKLRSGIESFYSASPRTFKNFTLRAGGTVGGFPQSLEHANFAAPSHHTDLQGLILAGDTVFPGQGVLGVTVSGYNAARTAARQLQKHPKLNHSSQKEAISC